VCRRRGGGVGRILVHQPTWPRPNIDTGGEFDVRSMFRSVTALISGDRGDSGFSRRRSRRRWLQRGEFATSVNIMLGLGLVAVASLCVKVTAFMEPPARRAAPAGEAQRGRGEAHARGSAPGGAVSGCARPLAPISRRVASSGLSLPSTTRSSIRALQLARCITYRSLAAASTKPE